MAEQTRRGDGDLDYFGVVYGWDGMDIDHHNRNGSLKGRQTSSHDYCRRLTLG